MEIAQIAVLIALAWMIIALVSNKVPFGAIGLGIPFILIIGGVFESPIKAMGDLAGPTTLLVASIMILAQGIFKSGLAEVIGNFALKLTGGRNSTKLVLLVIIVISAALSMFLPNTGCVTILLPVIIAISMSTGISRSQTLFVMNMAVGIGGCMTAIGTTINTAARGMIQDNGFGIIGFFDLGAAAIPAAILGTVFMLTIGYRLLPTRVKEDPALAAEESALTKELSPEESRKRRTAMIVAGISFLLVVIGVLTETLTGIQAWVWGMAGVLVLMCSRTISEKDAFAIPWGILMFVFGCSVLAAGFKTSGIAELAVGPITAILGDSPSPLVLTAVMFFVGAFFTQFMSNFGTFGIFSGVAITLATAVGANSGRNADCVGHGLQRFVCNPDGNHGQRAYSWRGRHQVQRLAQEWHSPDSHSGHMLDYIPAPVLPVLLSPTARSGMYLCASQSGYGRRCYATSTHILLGSAALPSH